MVSRRVVIGKYADGVTYGMKVALPGYDAHVEDGDSPNLTFNSEWTDIAYPHMMGFVSGFTATGYQVTRVSVPISDPGYVPWLEARLVSGNTINDDGPMRLRNNPTDPLGPVNEYFVGVGAHFSSRTPLTLTIPGFAGETVFWLTYKIPVVLV